MKAKKFELFLGRLGNGITVCNKAVRENGDNKYIAHISAAGNIKFYVDKSYIPSKDMARIREIAAQDGKKFREDFEKRDELHQYMAILDNISMAKMIEVSNDKRPLHEKMPELREYYYSIM